MTWQDVGLVIHQAPFGENWILLTLLTHYHGRFRGLYRPRSGSVLVGSQADVVWRGRLEEHLGYFDLDQIYPHSLMMGVHQGALQCLHLMSMFCYTLLPERIAMPEVYVGFLTALPLLPTSQGLWAFVKFESLLFKELGYETYEASGESPLDVLYEHQSLLETHWPQLTYVHQAHHHFIEELRALGEQD